MSKPLEQAELFIQEGKLAQAKEVLMGALSARLEDKGLCEDVVSMFLYGEMYEEAKEVFRLYRERTGKILEGDFSLEEVESLATGATADKEQYERSDVKVFKQMSVRESLRKRGHVIGLYSLPLINEIRIEPGRLAIRRWGKMRYYPWAEIGRATLSREPVQNRYVNFIERKLCITSRGDKVLFDQGITVFKHADLLIKELAKHCQLKEIKAKKRKEIPWWVYAFLLIAYLLVTRYLK